MKKNFKKLFIALLFSTSVFTLTYYFYHPLEQNFISNSRQAPLAYVSNAIDDIQKRPASKLLWVLVNNGEPLFDGEALRSSDHSEVRIHFSDSDRYLDLEPNSLIILKKSEEALALDLIEGGMFISPKKLAYKNHDGTRKTPRFIVKSGDKKLDLSQASASLSQSADKTLEIQILEGQATWTGTDGATQGLPMGPSTLPASAQNAATLNTIKIQSPLTGKPVMIDVIANSPDAPVQAIPIHWTDAPAGAQVTFWSGPSRKEMMALTTAAPGKNEISAELPFGKHYWKLVAANDKGEILGESPVQTLEVFPRYATTTLVPTEKPVPASAIELPHELANAELEIPPAPKVPASLNPPLTPKVSEAKPIKSKAGLRAPASPKIRVR